MAGAVSRRWCSRFSRPQTSGWDPQPPRSGAFACEPRCVQQGYAPSQSGFGLRAFVGNEIASPRSTERLVLSMPLQGDDPTTVPWAHETGAPYRAYRGSTCNSDGAPRLTRGTVGADSEARTAGDVSLREGVLARAEPAVVDVTVLALNSSR